MKVIGLLLITLGVGSLAQAYQHHYHLKCTENEMGIRWPSYESDSEYLVCHNRGARPMIVPCGPREVFTFVLQICTSPDRYIPPPPIDVLPTDSPAVAHEIKPLEMSHVHQPPIVGGHHQGRPQVMHQPPVIEALNIPKPPVVTVVEHYNEADVHLKPLEIPQQSVKPDKPLMKPEKPAALPPLPPTPAPTPPVVAPQSDNDSKKPTADKKKVPSKPTKTEEKKPTATKAEKKPTATKAEKKPTATKAEKKSPKKTSQNTPKKSPQKSPLKSSKKPATPVKKSPKAPTKA